MGKLKILIVDDVYPNRLIMGELIRNLGHEAVHAENGKVAIELCENTHFDLIFMDIEMPVMNGMETAEYIRNKMPYPKNLIPIIALTAHNPDLFFQDYTHFGFDELLTKPYSLEKITYLINNLQ